MALPVQGRLLLFFINRYYNKRKARLQEVAKRSNRLDITNRIEQLTEKRNNKVKDYLRMLIDMIRYKAELAGIRISIVKESYTSGTSYLDGEIPDKASYNISIRRTSLFLNIINCGRWRKVRGTFRGRA